MAGPSLPQLTPRACVLGLCLSSPITFYTPPHLGFRKLKIWLPLHSFWNTLMLIPTWQTPTQPSGPNSNVPLLLLQTQPWAQTESGRKSRARRAVRRKFSEQIMCCGRGQKQPPQCPYSPCTGKPDLQDPAHHTKFLIIKTPTCSVPAVPRMISTLQTQLPPQSTRRRAH